MTRILLACFYGLALVGSNALAQVDPAGHFKRASFMAPPAWRLDTVEEIREGPAGDPLALPPGSEVYCVYSPRRPGGSNPKFGCFRSSEETAARYRAVRIDQQRRISGDFYDKRGDLLTDVELQAANPQDAFADWGKHFIDRDGHQPDELKIKYQARIAERDFRPGMLAPDTKQRDRFTEALATRLFGALGFASDISYLPEAVHCAGCFEVVFKGRDRGPDLDSRVDQWTFRRPGIERRFPGSAPICSAAQVQSGECGDIYWGFPNAWRLVTGEQAIEFEALAILQSLVHHGSNNPGQQSMVCNGPPSAEGICERPIAYIQDLGSTFGGRSRKGDRYYWDLGRVLTEECRTAEGFKGIPVTRAGQERFLELAEQRLSDAKKRALFETAEVWIMDANLRVGLAAILQAGDSRRLGDTERTELIARLDELFERLRRDPQMNHKPGAGRPDGARFLGQIEAVLSQRPELASRMEALDEATLASLGELVADPSRHADMPALLRDSIVEAWITTLDAKIAQVAATTCPSAVARR